MCLSLGRERSSFGKSGVFWSLHLVAPLVVFEIAAGAAYASSSLTVDGGISGVSYENGCTFSRTSANPVSGGCSGPFSNTDNYYAGLNSDFEATANYNHLGAYAFQDIEIGVTIPSTDPIYAPASATAFISDNIELPSWYHNPAFVRFGYTANGIGYGDLTLSWGGGASCMKSIVSSQATCAKTQEIFPGNSYNLQVVLTADAGVSFSGSPGDELSQTSDFLHTAILTEVGIFDQNMNPLTGVQLVSDSGFDYQNNVLSEVPEPGGFWPIIGGMMLVGLLASCLNAMAKSE